jgi:hypothetical protein
MESAKKAPTEKGASLAAQLKLREIAENKKMSITLGKSTYKVHRLGNWTSTKITELMWRSQMLVKEGANLEINMDALMNNRTVVPRVLSYAILKYPWKIRLFHWWAWRKIDRTYTQEQYKDALGKIFSYGMDLDFYLSNLTFLLQAAMPEMMMAKETISSIAARQSSEQKTTSSSPSTDKSQGIPKGNTDTKTA